jgi:hypothetical protein
MNRYRMEGVDLRRLAISQQILSQVVDRLVDLDDSEPELEVEIDGLTPCRNYCRDCECCEGMDW